MMRHQKIKDDNRDTQNENQELKRQLEEMTIKFEEYKRISVLKEKIDNNGYDSDDTNYKNISYYFSNLFKRNNKKKDE
jgi:hypothetical protein